MNSPAATISATTASPVTSTTTAILPWPCRIMALAATCILTGIIWDISWHSTVGRDTFWTAAHLAIYLGGTLGGFCAAWLVWQATFRPDSPERAASVRFWGLRGPLGAWVTIWGALAMLTSAPFDDWWHNAYGLDVEILSPPHSVLAAGMYTLVGGALLLLLSQQNRASESRRAAGSGLYLYCGGIMLAMNAIMFTERSLPNQQHGASYYVTASVLYPMLFVSLARASKWKWPATTVAAVYTGLTCLAVWILPLFAATPKLAPIYNPVTHMVPPAFPQLFIVPAVVIDLWFRWIGRGRGWKRDTSLAVLMAAGFVGLFLAAQWNFAKFLVSPAAENAFFVGNQFWTFADARHEGHYRFWNLDKDPVTLRTVAACLGLAFVSTRLGLWLGNWMSRVRR